MLLAYERNEGKKNPSKVPSINKHCFLFPLSPFSPVLQGGRILQSSRVAVLSENPNQNKENRI